MSIVAADILYKFSVLTGSAGNSTAGTAAGSLGKYISTTQITDDVLGNLFDDVTGDENAASDIEYRCFFVHNNHATLTMKNTVMWLSAETAGGASAAISVDTTAASAIGSASAQAKQVVDENTAPTSQTFTAPTIKGAAVTIGDIAPGNCRAVWVRRTAANSSALAADSVTLQLDCDSL